MLADLAQAFRVNCEALLQDRDIVSELRGEKFDLGVSEYFDPCGLGLFRLIGLRKHITAFSSAFSSHTLASLGIPPMPSFVAGEYLQGFSDLWIPQ